ncbi:caspase-10 isoform X2 [Struthio camelus]|uniref:caspase-10 isoform X2 n=1 Tax=Struthio camelus TaxID=8801 RepID=UPI003603E602
MGDDISLKFRQQLLLIEENLGTEDVAALKFLCIDLIPFKKLESVQSALDIFQFLMAEEYLSEEDTFLLAELLYRIKCHFLLKKLGYTKERVQEYLPEKGRVSSYRQMLYELAENVTSEMLKEIIFLLRNQLPKRQTTISALELLILLEKQGLLTENNVQVLEELCMSVSPDLLEAISSYKREKVSLPQQENTLPVKESVLPHTGDTRLFTSPQETSVKAVSSNINDHYGGEPGSLWEHVGNVRPIPIRPGDKAANVIQGVSEMNLELRAKFINAENESKNLTSYKMDGPQRGFCLVINNVKFDGDLQERKGSCKDAEELNQVFTWLGLDVTIHRDLTSEQIKDLMQAWQNLEDHKDRDCFICCILSHGESGAIYGTDGERVSIRTIMSYFTAQQCPALAEKPKLFFIQACQGMATTDGYASFRHVQQGTWYIQALCSKLQLLVPRGEDILSILTEVNDDVSRRADSLGTKKQMPQPAYTLRRKFIFPVPRDPPPSQQH